MGGLFGLFDKGFGDRALDAMQAVKGQPPQRKNSQHEMDVATGLVDPNAISFADRAAAASAFVDGDYATAMKLRGGSGLPQLFGRRRGFGKLPIDMGPSQALPRQGSSLQDIMAQLPRMY